MLLKTKEGHPETKLKRAPNEPQLSVEMRALRVEFELCNSLHVLTRASIGERDRFEIAREREIQTTPRNYENRGNEAKKCLKTKEVTFFNAAIFAHYPHNLAAISAQMDQATPEFAKTRSGLATPARCYDNDKKSAR
jgi:hypothetical protein